MNPDEPKEQPAEEEGRILNILVSSPHAKNPKKLKNLARRLYDEVSPAIRRGMLDSILTSHDPVRYLKEAHQQLKEYQVIIKDLIDNGSHGMVIVNNVIYPLDLQKTQPSWLQPDNPWNMDEEKEIQYKVVDQWMLDNNKTSFLGRVVLFPAFGFSGYPRVISRPVE